MQYREVAWAQQLYFQRLLHGPGADITERSYPNYPGTAMREIIRQSEHPHNVEPLLLTLRRPQNATARKRFAEAAGELVLIEKVLSTKPIATDFRVAVHGRVVDAVDGILYPTKDSNTKYETWLRVEMLDVLRLMLEEGLVRSLVPEMQAKLIQDLLQLAGGLQDKGGGLQESSLQDDDASQENASSQGSGSGGSPSGQQQHGDELVRMYAFCAAFAALKRFPAARPAALRAGFLQAAAAYLAAVLDGGSRQPGSVMATDPFERLKAITTCVEAIYFVGLCSSQGEYSLAGAGAGSAAAGAGAAGAAGLSSVPSLQQLQRQQHLVPLLEARVAPLLVRAVQQAWQELQARNGFSYTPPASSKAAAEDVAGDEGGADNEAGASSTPAAENGGKAASSDSQQQQQPESDADRMLRQEAEEAVAAANMTFEENWQSFLKTVYGMELVPAYVRAAVQLGCGLLQLLAHEGAEGQLPSSEVLQQLAAYSEDPLLATTGSILLASTAAAAGVDGSTAIVALPQHQQLELAEFARLCHACCKPEAAASKLLKCSACGCVSYCSPACQKADWKAGHKQVCKELAASRTKLVAA